MTFWASRAINVPVEAVLPGRYPLRSLTWNPNSNTAHCDSATGSAIVFLHGLGDGADVWRPVISRWPGGLPIPAIALDLPGHGGSAWLAPGEYRTRTLADILAETLTRVRFSNVSLIGHSLGARIAVMIASEQLLRCDRLILVDPGPGNTVDADAGVTAHIDRVIAGTSNLETLLADLLTRLPLADEAVLRATIGALVRPLSGGGVQIPVDPSAKALLGELPPQAIARLMGRLSVPTGIVRGAFSSVLSRQAAETLAASVPGGARLKTIMRAGHAIALEQPAALAATLDQMLRSTPAR